jgi:hypothetical protein
MTHTEFVTRQKHGENHPLFPVKHFGLSLVDGLFIVGFLAVFVGLVLLLSR